MILQPQASFTVVRQIANHLDSDTNYVQAVIRNAYTDAIIETIQLTNKGSQRFSKNWQVPADPSGEGFYISIVTSVYSDSGYTTKNANYGDDENTYLVQERVLRHGGGGGGLGSADIRRIVREELDKLPQPEPVTIPEQKEPADRTDEILSAIVANKPKPAEKVNLAPVISRLNEAIQAIQEKEVAPPTDLTPVLDKLQQDNETNGLDFGELKDTLQAMEDRVVQTVESTIKKAMDETEFSSTFATRAQPKPAQQQQGQSIPFNVANLGL